MKKTLIIIGVIVLVLAGVLWKTGAFQSASESIKKTRVVLGELSELHSTIVDIAGERVNDVGVNKNTTYFEGDKFINYVITFVVEEPIQEFDIKNSDLVKEVVEIAPDYLEEIKDTDRITFQIVNNSRFLLIFSFSKSKSGGATYGEWKTDFSE